MNTWILCSGVLGLFTTFVHVFAGQIDPVRPFLKSPLETVPKATLLACWHMVSVTLLATSIVMSYIGWEGIESQYGLVLFLGVLYVLFTLVFVMVGWYFFGIKALVKLPQWVLLLPIGVMGIYGAM